jgi:hypothetical protein
MRKQIYHFTIHWARSQLAGDLAVRVSRRGVAIYTFHMKHLPEAHRHVSHETFTRNALSCFM